MSNSPLVSYTKISPNRTSPRNHKIDTITIHCVVGQCSVEGLGSVFSNSSYQASSNYGIGYDGRIGMYVEESDRSWCSSNAANDHRAITIEVASDTTHPYAVRQAAYLSLIELLVDICKRNGIKELKWKADKSLIGQVDKQNMTVHKWFANKSCPGEYLYSRHAEIAAAVNKKLGVIAETKKEESKVEETKPVTKPESTESKTETAVTVKMEVGDVVSITKNATYYNGTDIPGWVQRKNWIIKSISGDRVVIDRSEDGLNAICSPVHAKYLSVVAKKADTPFMVKIDIPNLNIRKGPGTNYSATGSFTGKGVFTITEVKTGSGSDAGWGKLKSGVGWVSLDYAKKI